MEKVIIRDDFIKLGQAMKLAGMVGSGVDAKMLIQDGQVEVNGEVEYQRGKKLHEEMSLHLTERVFRSANDYKITGIKEFSQL